MPENANVVAHIVCTGAVPYLSINPVRLFRNFSQVGSGSNEKTNTTFVNANAAALCISANYSGDAVGNIVFPPGYNPATWTGGVTSNTVALIC